MAAASASFSATHTISVPGSTLQEFGTVRLAPTGIVIPRDMWVRVRVSGSLRIDADPEWVRRFCNPGPPSECPPPYDGASAGPLGVNDGLEVQVAMNNAYFLWRPRAAGGDAAEDIMWVSAGTRVLAGRAGLWEFGDCWGCTHQPGRAGRYRLTGSQTLTVEEINPLSVRADRTETDPAEPVGFTARADEEMRNLEWAFVAGDTLPESGPAAARAPAGGASFSTSAAPAPAADWDALASCRRKEACTTLVAASGRMWVRGHIEDQIVFAKSEIVRVQPVRLKLDCTPNPVTRGQSITCTASKDPASAPGELTVTGWQFVGGDFKYPDAGAGDEIPTGTTWGGEMAMSGTITVTAKVNGTEESKSVGVTVEGRTTFKQKRVDVSIRPGTLADLPEDDRPFDPPQSVTDLGRAIPKASTSGYDPKTNMAEVLRNIRMIQDEGPNHGLAYLKEVPMQPTAIVVIHPALTRGSAFYQAQAQTSNVVHGTPPCLQSRWDEYVRLVEEHEGLHGNLNSHVGFFQAALNPTAAEAVEHVVGRVDNLASMAQEWQQLLNPVVERALAQSSNDVFHKAPGGLVRFGCEFNFDVRGR